MRTPARTDLIRRLKYNGLKLTPQRLAIIDVLVEHSNSHPGVTLIFNEARKKAKRISLSTVYATLKEFSENGLVKQLEFDRMENRYDGNLSDHVNLICKGCSAIIDCHIPAPLASDDITGETGFVVTDTRIDFYGYCRDCLKRPD